MATDGRARHDSRGAADAAAARSLDERLREALGEQAHLDLRLEAEDESGRSAAAFAGELRERLATRGPAFGRYRMQAEIARGGMGIVLRVWDGDLNRNLALKLLVGADQAQPGTPAADRTRALARFLEEAQVTAQLDHPGIVPVHELGLDPGGQIYFTMKLVRGRELREIVELGREQREGWSEVRVLGVLLKVCEAMTYAHSKGVVHRDLKPANVMVGRYGEVYVMDWGLARILGRADRANVRPCVVADQSQIVSERRQRAGSAADSPLVTMDGDVLGTPAYMSPEQARGELDRIGPQSDVYAVGAMLYHVLAGHMPYVPPGATASGQAVWARVQEGPPSPLAEVAPRAAAELVAITERAMARDPAGRYSDMGALAADLSAYLEGRVVRAYEAGAWAEGRKWVQRNRGLAAAMGVAALSLAVGLAVSLSQRSRAVAAAEDSSAAATRAGESARVADAERQKAEASATFLEQMLATVQPSVARGRDTAMLREMLETAAAKIDAGDLAAYPEAELRLRLVIGSAEMQLGELGRAVPRLEAALALARELHPDLDDAGVAEALNLLGMARCEAGELREAETLLLDAQQMRRRLSPGGSIALANSTSNLALVRKRLGDLSEAERLTREAAAMSAICAPGDDAQRAEYANQLGEVLRARGDPEGAERELELALEIRRRLHPSDHPALAASLNNVGHLRQTAGDLAGAAPLQREALAMQQRLHPGDHPDIAAGLNNLGQLLAETGDLAGALEHARAAVDMYARLFPGDHPAALRALSNLGTLLKDAGELAAAAPFLEQALAMARRLAPEGSEDVGVLCTNLGALRHSEGRLEEAMELKSEALEVLGALGSAEHPRLAAAWNSYGYTLSALGRVGEAEQATRRALELLESRYPTGHPDSWTALNNLGSLAQDQGRVEEAGVLYERALGMATALFGEQDARTAATVANLASLRRDAGDFAGAEPLARRALAIRRAVLPVGHWAIGLSCLGQGECLLGLERFEESETLLLEAMDTLSAAQGARPDLIEDCAKALVELYGAWAAAEPGTDLEARAEEWRARTSAPPGK